MIPRQRTLLLGVGAIVVFAAIAAVVRRPGPARAPAAWTAPDAGVVAAPPPPPEVPSIARTPIAPDGGAATAGDFTPPTQTARDRALRDEVLRRIVLAWGVPADGSVGSGLDQPPAPEDLDPAHPPVPPGALDPDYIRSRIQDDLVPMATTCYDQLLTRSPGARGEMAMEFTIVGAPGVGGVVEEAELDFGAAREGPLTEADFARCIRESLMTVSFRPPGERGRIRVRYPLRFAPEAPDASAPDAAPATPPEAPARPARRPRR